MNELDKLIQERLEQAVKDRVFPGCVLGIVNKEGQRKIFTVGSLTYDPNSPAVVSDIMYDLASVTKAIPGSAILLKLIDENKISLEDRLVDYVPEFGNFENKKEVKIKHILTYTLDLEIPSMASLKNKSPEDISDIVIKAPLKSVPGSKYLYTNSTAFFIHLIVEKFTGRTIDKLADEFFFKPLQMSRTTFYPEKFDKTTIAPTEIDEWRGRVIQGEVHDESTYTLRRKYLVAIAGLFSTVPDLLTFEEMLLNGGLLRGKRYFSEEIVKEMYNNQIHNTDEPAGLGWEINQPIFMGKYAEEIFGKSGFTGTMILINPKKGVALALLSNRIYPKRHADRGAANYKLRNDIADMVFGERK
ncbi:MAG: serine hydrolase [bacterium]